MNLFRSFLTLALLTQVWVGNAQVYFNEQVDFEHNFEFYSGCVLFNNSTEVLLAGGNSPATSYFDNFFLSKISPLGDIQWKKSFLPYPDASGNTMNLLKLDEQFSLVFGNADLLNASPDNYQLFLFKIRNETGEIIWQKEIGDNNSQEGGNKIITTSDGGFAITGLAFPVDNSQKSKVLFLKVDSLGNQIFRKEFTSDSDKYHHVFSLLQTSDGGFLILAYRSYNGPYLGGFGDINKIDWVLIKTDALGNMQWIKATPPSEWKQNLFYGTDIQPLPNNEFIVSGVKGYAPLLPGYSFNGRYFFCKYNAQGEIIDSVTLPNNYYFFRVTRLKPSGDGNFWAIGAERDSATTGNTGLIMKISPDLKVLWKREYRVSPPESLVHEIFYEGAMMPDKGFVLCGGAYGPIADSTYANGWVIRVDSLGCLEPGCD
ncbi:hypothetical protein, partial [Runella sp.]|uniref:hypothetical protein n=1 Tax=Runella sp. TaxID=1960881 RepID=UPI0030163C90